MDTLVNDVRFALRQMVKGRGTTILLVLTLAMGVGANTAMFSFLNALLFKDVQTSNPEQLVWVTYGPRANVYGSMSYPQYIDVRDKMRTISSPIAYKRADVAMGGTVPQLLQAKLVSGNFFSMLGVRAHLGRMLVDSDDGPPGANAVAVLSYNAWVRLFGSDAGVVNREVVFNGHKFVVVGVAPNGFSGIEFDEPPQVWFPFAMTAVVSPSDSGLLANREWYGLAVVGRLAANASRGQAQAEATVLSNATNDQHGARKEEIATYSVTPVEGALYPSRRDNITKAAGLLGLIPFLVLLVACSNAANMQLARASARRREFAVRRALGASRGRLVSQLLTESVLVALLAGALGIVLSFLLTRVVSSLGSVPGFVSDSVNPDVRVMLVTTALAVLTGIAFGLSPALSATSPALVPALKDDGASVSVGRNRHRLRSVLVVSQVSVSLVLLVVAGLFLRSLDKALAVDPGFEARNGITVQFDTQLQRMSREARISLQRNLVEHARAIPGVTSAALSTSFPLGDSHSFTAVQNESAARDDFKTAEVSSVSPEYFATLRLPLARGREFAESDAATSAPVAIVDEVLARKLWPGENAIGRRLRIAGDGEPLREVVGVARTARNSSLTKEPRGTFYLPESQKTHDLSMWLSLRINGNSASTVAAVRAVFRQLAPDMPLSSVQTFEEVIANSIGGQRAGAALLGVFGTLALVLASLGMYGVTSHGVTQRTREIGIRMSLGARSADVLSMFVREGLKLSMVGVGVGLVLSLALSQLLTAYLFGVGGTDILAFASGALVLCVVSIAASFVPARRASKADPLRALKSE